MKMQPFDAEMTELMTVGEFIEAVRDGLFIYYDGSGYYGTPDFYDREAPAVPSEIYRGQVRNNGYGYVHWFNK